MFHCEQSGNVLTFNYSGGNVIKGHLIGVVDAEGTIDMRYHQVNAKEYLMTGICQSKPEIMKD